MPLALILAKDSLERDLGQTVLWRRNMERRLARTLQEARVHSEAVRPDIIVVDNRFPAAAEVVGELRQDERTRPVSIVALARGDFDSSEIALLQAGANAILRLPPGPDWDDRLVRLIHVPQRKDARLSVHLLIEDTYSSGEQFMPAMALNLSVNGMLVESGRALGIGEDIHFTFHLPDSPLVVAGSGTVVRLADGPRQFGIELTHVEGDGRVRIRQFVEASGD
jgi:CheY-like chemotaxis protein